MDKLDQIDELQMTTHGAIQEIRILSDYLGDIDTLVVKLENDRNHDNAIELAYEVTRLIERMGYLKSSVLDKLIEIQELINVDVVEV